MSQIGCFSIKNVQEKWSFEDMRAIKHPINKKAEEAGVTHFKLCSMAFSGDLLFRSHLEKVLDRMLNKELKESRSLSLRISK